MKNLIYLFIAIPFLAFSQKVDHQVTEVPKAQVAPVIDGNPDDEVWNTAAWHALDQRWLGKEYSPEDFTGRYKVTWTDDGLYLLVYVEDDVLMDQHEDPLYLYWDDDCVEVFVDEDNSGGDHQYSYNAFAYHVALNKNVVDINPDEEFKLYNDHVQTARNTKGNKSYWELAVKLYDDSYDDNAENAPVKLEPGKKVGFALAYCDNDQSKERENFIGSVYVPGEDKNRGWIDAGIFGTLLLTLE